MKKLTKSQQKELIVWEYFMPIWCEWLPKTETDIIRFFEWSEQGKHKETHYGDCSYFEALRQGKRYAGINIHELYEPGILEGTMPYFTILGGEKTIPREVVEFLKKEIFKGMNADVIEICYQRVCNDL